MDLVKLHNIEEFTNYYNKYANKRLVLEERIIKEFKENGQDFVLGYCKVCDKATKFKIILDKDMNTNLRESLVCEYCKLSNRKRFMLSFLKEFASKSNSKLNVFMYEQVTELFKSAQNMKNINLVGSEFLGYDKKSGEIIENIRNEDAMNLSFKRNSFDVLISNDVYEHIPNITKVLSEAYRVLKNSGKLLISIPFFGENVKTKRRATFDEGKIKYLQQPIYHENPIAEKEGSLVFYEYGWDFLDFLKSAGFTDAYMLVYYDMFYGHLGNVQAFIFVAIK